jgi:AraC-like DNA-binding protein
MTNNEWQVDANIKAWTKAITIGMWLYTLAFLSYFILVACSFFNPEWDYAISFTMALGIIGITYMGLIQKRIFSSEPIGTFLPVQKYQSSSLTPGASESIRQRLERLMKEEQVFKENELRLDDLAEYLEISRHQMSQVINEHYGVSFFELINKYRVDYVKRALADRAFDQHTIIQIAYEAGFNNKASFNRYFKQETGLTPSAYRIKEQSLPAADVNRLTKT